MSLLFSFLLQNARFLSISHLCLNEQFNVCVNDWSVDCAKKCTSYCFYLSKLVLKKLLQFLLTEKLFFYARKKKIWRVIVDIGRSQSWLRDSAGGPWELQDCRKMRPLPHSVRIKTSWRGVTRKIYKIRPVLTELDFDFTS